MPDNGKDPGPKPVAPTTSEEVLALCKAMDEDEGAMPSREMVARLIVTIREQAKRLHLNGVLAEVLKLLVLQWGRGNRLGINGQALRRLKPEWALRVEINHKTSDVTLEVEGAPKMPSIILPGGR